MKLLLRQIAIFAILILTPAFVIKAVNHSKNKTPLKFGVIADCQYSNYDSANHRMYRLSEKKLSEAVTEFNSQDLDFVIHLGDFIDKDYESFDVVAPIYNQLNAPHYHVLGNHDFAVADDKKDSVTKRLGMSAKYYDFTVDNWRFIVLDGNDISFYAYPEGSKEYAQSEQYYEKNGIEAPKWDGAIGNEQLAWLQQTIENTAKEKQKVIVFCHFPVYPEGRHCLWNQKEVVDLLEKYDNVKAYMNGHKHTGDYAEKEGKHYINFIGMVDTYQTAFSVVTLTDNSIEIKGYGREKDRVVSF